MQPQKHTNRRSGPFGIRLWIPVIMALNSCLAQAEPKTNPAEAYLMYDRNGPTYQYQSSTSGAYSDNYRYQTGTVAPMTHAQSVTLPSGQYLVIPNSTTGRTMAIIQTSKGK